MPAAVRAGDLLLAWFAAGSGHVPSGPGPGWQQVNQVADAGLTATLWRRVATATDAGAAIQLTSAQQKGVLTVAAYRGVHPVNPIAAHGVATQPALTTTHASATVNNPIADGWRLSYWSLESRRVTTLTPPTGEVPRAVTNGTGSGRVTTLLTDTGAPVAAGTQGNLTALSDASTNKATLWTVILRPA